MITENFYTYSRILVVDDEPANLRLLSRLLNAEGYKNIEAIQDPRQVMGIHEREPADLILLDLNMPYLSGYDIITALKSHKSALSPQIIILTALNDQQSLLKALALGARDFVGKPFDRNELLMRVRNLLESQLALRMLHDQKATLEKIVQLRTQELYDNRLDVIQRLGKAAEYKDEETGSHILRVSHSAAILAKAIGWNRAQCDAIFNAAPMHDIGKIGIPDAILCKPGKLTEEEWKIMQTHAQIGADLLKGDDSEIISMAHIIALTHHEKWDGTGYPNQLAGEEIPMAGRIIALVDVFDALTSIRPYKKAWEIKEACEFIRANSGKHFDPNLVERFFENFAEINALKEKFV